MGDIGERMRLSTRPMNARYGVATVEQGTEY